MGNSSKLNTYRIILLIIYGVGIIWSAVNPISGDNWLLEMIPVFAGLAVTFFLGRKYRISDLSYTLIFLYMLMPLIQAHYGVGYVPFGVKAASWLGLERNVFDRLTHFMFGFLWLYPLYEMTRKSIGDRAFLDYMIPASVLLALGSVYEVCEWIVYEFLSDELSFLFIGAQEDFYDTPKDMAMTMAGVILALFISWVGGIVHEKITYNHKAIYWAARLLTIAFAVFLSLFAFDVFTEDISLWEKQLLF